MFPTLGILMNSCAEEITFNNVRIIQLLNMNILVFTGFNEFRAYAV